MTVTLSREDRDRLQADRVAHQEWLDAEGEQRRPVILTCAYRDRANGKCRNIGRVYRVFTRRAEINWQAFFPRIRTVERTVRFEDRDGNEVAASLGCHGSNVLRDVEGTYNEAKECNARCMGARGPSCECRCGGELHGGRWG